MVGEQINTENLNALVERHMAFLLRTVSNLTGRYVCAGHDDEFSIALSAFAEAVERYDAQRGNFLAFAGLVIRSRVTTHLEQKNRTAAELSLEALQENGQDFAAEPDEEADVLQEEIRLFQAELALFGLTLEVLADEAPKHSDTRKTAIETAEKASAQPALVALTYQKKRLPLREVSRLCQVTEKMVKRSKSFILATMLVFVKQLPNLIYWIKGSRYFHV